MKSAYRHVGSARFPVTENPVSQDLAQVLTTSRLVEPFKQQECCAHSSDVLRFADKHEGEIAMDEEEFDALIHLRPFGTEDAKRADIQFRRSVSLAATLWGKTADDLRRQLLAPSPEIPSGFDLADFRDVLQTIEQILAAITKSRTASASQTIVVGTQRYTEWEARCEIIRRAIEYLENR